MVVDRTIAYDEGKDEFSVKWHVYDIEGATRELPEHLTYNNILQYFRRAGRAVPEDIINGIWRWSSLWFKKNYRELNMICQRVYSWEDPVNLKGGVDSGVTHGPQLLLFNLYKI